ncbi:hypothetical protein Tco_0590468 [Tanacetum coccineum]
MLKASLIAVDPYCSKNFDIEIRAKKESCFKYGSHSPSLLALSTHKQGGQVDGVKSWFLMRILIDPWRGEENRCTLVLVDKLVDALWAFSTAYKTPIGCTRICLVREGMSLRGAREDKAYWDLKHTHFDIRTALCSG